VWRISGNAPLARGSRAGSPQLGRRSAIATAGRVAHLGPEIARSRRWVGFLTTPPDRVLAGRLKNSPVPQRRLARGRCVRLGFLPADFFRRPGAILGRSKPDNLAHQLQRQGLIEGEPDGSLRAFVLG
jgi:hypothetical protein